MATIQRFTPSHPTLTRRRGEDTYEQLRPYLDSGQVELLLPSDVPLSLSYLDGIILKLLAAQRLQDVTFRDKRQPHLPPSCTDSGNT